MRTMRHATLTFQLGVARTNKDDEVAGRRARTNESNAISTWMLIELPILSASEPVLESNLEWYSAFIAFGAC
jgi:hypothetical protein